LISGIDHIAIAVNQLEESIAFYRDILLLPFDGIEEVEDQRVRVACFKLGDTRIELLEPTSPDSPIAKFLADKGPGLHHLALRTDDIGGELQRLSDHGLQLIDKSPRAGANGMQIAFIHPKSSQRVLTELTQPGPSISH
jgi:methylmalonyl-CoA/ethylmalonyl-CoA epimerase